jgi:flagellar basal-body rod protein FlgG
MNYGLHVSASGVLTNLYRQDIHANNLANASTVGFKRDLAMITQRDPESVEGPNAEFSNALLDNIGGGAFAGPQHISFEAGSKEKTNNPLDLALEADDTFFAVRKRNGKSGQDEIRYTRDGRFARSPEGFLVTAAGGFKVLGDDDQPITLDESQGVVIDRDGGVRQNNVEVAKLQVTALANRQLLVKVGQSLYRDTAKAGNRLAPGNGRVMAGFVEASAVNPIQELLGMIETSSAIQYNSNLIKYHDTLNERAVSLGRLVA